MASSRFSGVLQITDLDDFIGPSQECIKPVQFDKPKRGTGSRIQIKSDDSSFESMKNESMNKPEKLKKVEISLSDCLACSGCITSAESVLITQQSQEEVLKVLNENNKLKLSNNEEQKLIIVSLSVQPVLSLSLKFELSLEQTVSKLCGFFKRLGVDLLLDIGVAHDLALKEISNEFLEKYQNGVPIFTSACPGWICYAEKSHGNFVLPYISTVKSPQQIMGTLVKTYLSEKLGVHPKNIYHVTLMPCYDKKLEASRNDFYNETLGYHDVDCVLTPVEMEVLIDNELASGESFKNEIDTNLDWPWDDNPPKNLLVVEGSGSGGYAHQIFLNVIENVFPNFCKDNINVNFQPLRNPDLREFTFQHDNKTLRFCIANGFRNIQNLIQKLKRKKLNYDFIEIMACPVGCLNGGAQIKKDANHSKDTALTLETMQNGLVKHEPDGNGLVSQLYLSWLGGKSSDKTKFMLLTSYHDIPKNNIALNVKW